MSESDFLPISREQPKKWGKTKQKEGKREATFRPWQRWSICRKRTPFLDSQKEWLWLRMPATRTRRAENHHSLGKSYQVRNSKDHSLVVIHRNMRLHLFLALILLTLLWEESAGYESITFIAEDPILIVRLRLVPPACDPKQFLWLDQAAWVSFLCLRIILLWGTFLVSPLLSNLIPCRD